MGTRADFYVGRGEKAEWLGSIAWDGYPVGITEPILKATDEALYRKHVAAFIGSREDGTKPEMGWPWPWENSQTTDYAYAFDGGQVWGTSFAHGWWAAAVDEPEPDYDAPISPKVVFPDMSMAKAARAGSKRSGVMVISVPNSEAEQA